MAIYSYLNRIRNITTILFILVATSFLFAQEPSLDSTADSRNLSWEEEKNLSTLQKQARTYRDEGLTQQSMGNLEAAMVFYQKAIKLDPSYAVAYNDLGIIYETYGWIDRAEQSYLQAIKFDQNFLSPYSNLALLYENKQDLNKAYFYWKKRAELGLPNDPWTQKAKNKIDELIQALPDLRQALIEKEAIALMEEIIEKKRSKQLEDMKEAKKHFEVATELYRKNEYKLAIDELNSYLSLNPQDKDALAMLDKAKTKLKDQEREANTKKLEKYFQDGMGYYQEDNLQAAKQEFERIIELTASPQKN